MYKQTKSGLNIVTDDFLRWYAEYVRVVGRHWVMTNHGRGYVFGDAQANILHLTIKRGYASGSLTNSDYRKLSSLGYIFDKKGADQDLDYVGIYHKRVKAPPLLQTELVFLETVQDYDDYISAGHLKYGFPTSSYVSPRSGKALRIRLIRYAKGSSISQRKLLLEFPKLIFAGRGMNLEMMSYKIDKVAEYQKLTGQDYVPAGAVHDGVAVGDVLSRWSASARSGRLLDSDKKYLLSRGVTVPDGYQQGARVGVYPSVDRLYLEMQKNHKSGTREAHAVSSGMNRLKVLLDIGGVEAEELKEYLRNLGILDRVESSRRFVRESGGLGYEELLKLWFDKTGRRPVVNLSEAFEADRELGSIYSTLRSAGTRGQVDLPNDGVEDTDFDLDFLGMALGRVRVPILMKFESAFLNHLKLHLESVRTGGEVPRDSKRTVMTILSKPLTKRRADALRGTGIPEAYGYRITGRLVEVSGKERVEVVSLKRN